MPQHVRLVAADMVGQLAGEKLRAAPDEAIDTDDPADIGQAHAVLVEKHRIEHPDQRIDEFLHQPGLADRSHAFVAPRHQREYFPGVGLSLMLVG